MTEKELEALNFEDDSVDMEEEDCLKDADTKFDPYFQVKPSPNDYQREHLIDDNGNLTVKNPSAFFLPEFAVEAEIGGTIYSVSGSYDGTNMLTQKLRKIYENQMGEKG